VDADFAVNRLEDVDDFLLLVGWWDGETVFVYKALRDQWLSCGPLEAVSTFAADHE